MDVFLDLNGYELRQTDEEIEEMILSLAAGTVGQGEFFGWVVNHTKPTDEPASNVRTFNS
jgi:prophage maintenance system killer protein